MARTPSTMMLDLGSPAPAFNLADYGVASAGRLVGTPAVSKGRPLLVMFICNHCPFVKHVRAELAKLGQDFGGGPGSGRVAIVAINPNDVEHYPDDRPELMTAEAKEAGYTFPYLFDATQEVAKAYRAACTPDFFLFDKGQRLAYRGQLDDSRPNSGIPVTGKDLRAAIDAVLNGNPIGAEQRPSLGCNIKWKPGNEPEYYLSPT